MSYYLRLPSRQHRYSVLSEPGSAETYTNNFWLSISQSYFPEMQDLQVNWKPPSDIPNENAPARDIVVCRVRYSDIPGESQKKTVMVFECRRRGFESHAGEWGKAYGQLKAHLESVFRHERGLGVDILYGAVAIGRYIRFYVFERGDTEMFDYGPVNPSGQPWEAMGDEETIHNILLSLQAIALTPIN